MNKNDAFVILEIPKDSTNDDIRKAYRLLSKKYHPDNLGTGDSRYFIKLKKAYNILMGIETENGENIENKVNEYLKTKFIHIFKTKALSSIYHAKKYVEEQVDNDIFKTLSILQQVNNKISEISKLLQKVPTNEIDMITNECINQLIHELQHDKEQVNNDIQFLEKAKNKLKS